MTMKNSITTIIQKIINFFKSFFKKKTNKIETVQSDEPVKPEVKRLVYNKRTGQQSVFFIPNIFIYMSRQKKLIEETETEVEQEVISPVTKKKKGRKSKKSTESILTIV